MSNNREKIHHTLAMLTVGFNKFGIGMGVGWIPPTLIALQNSEVGASLTMTDISWIASIDQFGRVLGSILSATFLDIVGRKPVLMCSAAIFFLTWLVLVFTKSVFMICVVRVVFGIAVGLDSGTNSIYIGENLSPRMRGFFSTISLALYDIGMFSEVVIATCFSYRTTVIINFFIQAAFFLASYWLQESVPFLIMKGNQKKAMENLMWLSGVTDAENVKAEFEKIQLNVEAEKVKKASIRKVITARANYKSVLIVIIIYAFSGMSGYATILTYSSIIFQSSEIMSLKSFTILFAAVQLFVTISSSFFVDNFNRRSFIVISFSLAGLIHSCTAFLYYTEYNLNAAAYGPWSIFLSIMLYSMVYQFVYPALFLIRSELFPLSIRPIATCLSKIGISLTTFVTVKMFSYIYSNYGIYYNFMMFSVSSWVLVFFVYFALPETRNRTLIEIQDALEKQK